MGVPQFQPGTPLSRAELEWYMTDRPLFQVNWGASGSPPKGLEVANSAFVDPLAGAVTLDRGHTYYGAGMTCRIGQQLGWWAVSACGEIESLYGSSPATYPRTVHQVTLTLNEYSIDGGEAVQYATGPALKSTMVQVPPVLIQATSSGDFVRMTQYVVFSGGGYLQARFNTNQLLCEWVGE